MFDILSLFDIHLIAFLFRRLARWRFKLVHTCVPNFSRELPSLYPIQMRRNLSISKTISCFDTSVTGSVCDELFGLIRSAALSQYNAGGIAAFSRNQSQLAE